jgi:hypothetical protein
MGTVPGTDAGAGSARRVTSTDAGPKRRKQFYIAPRPSSAPRRTLRCAARALGLLAIAAGFGLYLGRAYAVLAVPPVFRFGPAVPLERAAPIDAERVDPAAARGTGRRRSGLVIGGRRLGHLDESHCLWSQSTGRPGSAWVPPLPASTFDARAEEMRELVRRKARFDAEEETRRAAHKARFDAEATRAEEETRRAAHRLWMERKRALASALGAAERLRRAPGHILANAGSLRRKLVRKRRPRGRERARSGPDDPAGGSAAVRTPPPPSHLGKPPPPGPPPPGPAAATGSASSSGTRLSKPIRGTAPPPPSPPPGRWTHVEARNP